jgi:hypothetical protein
MEDYDKLSSEAGIAWSHKSLWDKKLLSRTFSPIEIPDGLAEAAA